MKSYRITHTHTHIQINVIVCSMFITLCSHLSNWFLFSPWLNLAFTALMALCNAASLFNTPDARRISFNHLIRCLRLPLKYCVSVFVYLLLTTVPDNLMVKICTTISVQFSWPVISNSLWPHGLQQARPPCPSPTPRACSNSCPLSHWFHPTIPFFVIPFSSCLQYFPVSGSFQMSWFFPSGGQSIGVSTSASVLPKNIEYWFPLGFTGWISLQSKRLPRVSSNTAVLKHQFFNSQLLL